MNLVSFMVHEPIYRSDSNQAQDAANDLRQGLARHTLWVKLGLQEVKTLYRGSLLGALWIALSFLIFGTGLIWFFGALSAEDGPWFATYLLSGLFVFQFISTSITSACTVFISAGGWLRSQRLPLSVFAYKLVFRNTINLALTAITAFTVSLFYSKHSIEFGALLAIPGLMMLTFTSFWVAILLGIISTRFRDAQHLVTTIMRFAFFITPVIWVASDVGPRAQIANWNPITHYIAIVRDPILHGTVEPFHWWIVIGISSMIAVISVISFIIYRRRIVFWL